MAAAMLLNQAMAASFVPAGDGHGAMPLADPHTAQTRRSPRRNTPELGEIRVATTQVRSLSRLRERVGRGCLRNGTIPKRKEPSPATLCERVGLSRMRERRSKPYLENAHDDERGLRTDTGLDALLTLLHLQGVAADREQLRHRLGTASFGAADIVRCAKSLGFESANLSNAVGPSVGHARCLRSRCCVTAASWSSQRPPPTRCWCSRRQAQRPVLMERDELCAIWDGGLDPDGPARGSVRPRRQFDITWFIGAICKYRRLLGEVLVASFFLQLFALVSPLFFQVVIDKVLVHRRCPRSTCS